MTKVYIPLDSGGQFSQIIGKMGEAIIDSTKTGSGLLDKVLTPDFSYSKPDKQMSHAPADYIGNHNHCGCHCGYLSAACAYVRPLFFNGNRSLIHYTKDHN